MVSKSQIPGVMGPLPNGPKINGGKNGDDTNHVSVRPGMIL